MGLTDRFRNIFFKEKEPEKKEYQEYKSCIELNQNDINRFKKYIGQFSTVAEDYKGKDSTAYKNALEEVSRYQYCLYEAEKTAKFIRPNSSDDIEYRNRQLNSFTDKLKEILPGDLDIRFHGTPVYFAEEILKSGTISSSADRFDGYVKSTDDRGEISVSDINSLSRTVNYFLDVTAYHRCLPCGCLFVLNADGQSQEQKGRSVMNSIDFKQEPERLYAIVTTPENIEKVKGWLFDSHMSMDLAYTFDGFIKKMEIVQEKKGHNNDALNDKVENAITRCNTFSMENQNREITR